MYLKNDVDIQWYKWFIKKTKLMYGRYSNSNKNRTWRMICMWVFSTMICPWFKQWKRIIDMICNGIYTVDIDIMGDIMISWQVLMMSWHDKPWQVQPWQVLKSRAWLDNPHEEAFDGKIILVGFSTCHFTWCKKKGILFSILIHPAEFMNSNILSNGQNHYSTLMVDFASSWFHWHPKPPWISLSNHN